VRGGGDTTHREIIFIVEEAEEGGYNAYALSKDCIVTQDDDLDELREMVRDVVQVAFDEEDRPAIIVLRFVREETIAA
jgi:hypothetical protein